MHIAFFTNYYHPVVNGVVRSVQSFREALTDLGHNVFVFAQEDDYEDSEPFIFRYPSLRLPLPVKKHLPDPGRIPEPFARFSVFRNMRHYLHESATGEPVQR